MLNLVRGGAGENEGTPQSWATDDPAEGHSGVAFTAHWSAQHRALSAKTVLSLRNNASNDSGGKGPVQARKCNKAQKASHTAGIQDFPRVAV